jgi:hypothetical protein
MVIFAKKVNKMEERVKGEKERGLRDYIILLERYDGDEGIMEFREYLKKILRSPYLDTYNAIYKNIESFNRQLTFGSLDIFGESGDKSFERGDKYMSKATEYLAVLDAIRSKLLEDEEVMLEEKMKKKVRKGERGVAI